MTVLAMGDVIDRSNVGELCDRARALLALGAGELICDVHAVESPDAATVDALARIQLIVNTSSAAMSIRGASDQLRDLIVFMGLRDVLVLEARR